MDDQNETESNENSDGVSLPTASCYEDREYDYHHPKIKAWRRKTCKQAKAFHAAGKQLTAVLSETRPWRPWHKRRVTKALDEYERTFYAWPNPPTPEDYQNVESTHANARDAANDSH